MSDKVDLKIMNNNLSVEETLKVQEELRKAVEQTELSKIPYSTEYLLRDLKSCVTSILSERDVAKKWSSDIAFYVEEIIECFARDGIDVEENLFLNIGRKTYKNIFKNIYYDVILIAGKLLLQEKFSSIEIEQLILDISNHINKLYVIGCKIYGTLYCEEDDYNSHDYVELFDDISDADCYINSIYHKFLEIDYKPIDVQKEKCSIEISRLREIYKKLLEVASDVMQLDIDNELYQHKGFIKDFLIKLANELIFTAGKFYIEIDNYSDIQYKLRNTIIKLFEKLETKFFVDKLNLIKAFEKLKDIQRCGVSLNNTLDYDIIFGYEELKASINNLIFAQWKYKS